jgi:preprotein translocase subunit SecB
MADQPQAGAAGAAPAEGPVLTIEKVYLKDCSLEVPNAPQVFLEEVQPQIDVQMGTQAQQIGEGLYESTLLVTVTAKAGDKTVFLCEVKQSAIFQIRGFGQEEMSAIIGIGCPTTIFPYARESVANLVNRAGFPPINLAPVSFEALYMQQMQQQQGAVGNGTGNGSANGAGPKIEIAR